MVSMRIGIMGGTLDPIHNGHLQSAEFVRKYLELDRVMLLPAGDPPHKLHPIDKYDRLEMVRLAAKGHEELFACSIEIDRDKTTYTVDTLRELHAKDPAARWFYIIGADTLDVVDSWREFASVAQLCTFAVIGRGSEDANRSVMKRLEKQYGAKFECIPFSGPDISSTEVREKVALGEDISELVPAEVTAYIRKLGIYLCTMPDDRIKEKLKELLKPSRYIHTLGVADTAMRLAERFGVDPRRAYLAGLLHDCAKYMPLAEMQRSVKAGIEDWDPEELESVSLLHAPAGCVMAREVFGVRDPAILSAIRRHTLGDADMSPMDALIYTADFIEPNRKPFPGLDEVRALAETDIYAAMKLCTELTRQYVTEQGNKLHPRTLKILEND